MQSFLLICVILLSSLALSAQAGGNYRLLSSQDARAFVDELAESSKLGFRLVKVSATPNDSRSFNDMALVGVLEHDPGQRYEYDWFEAYSPHELEGKINDLAKSGFYFKETIPFAENYCGVFSTTIVRPGATPIERADALLTDVLTRADVVNAISYGGIFIVEKKTGNKEVKNYKVAADTIAADSLGLKGTSGELLKQHLDIVIRDGFRPVGMMSLRQLNRVSAVVLLESDRPTSKSNLEAIVTRSDFEKKVDRFAKNGYRVLFSGGNGLQRYALMEQENKIPASYRWVDLNSRKEYGSRSELVFRDGVFQAVSYGIQGCDLITTHLVFRSPTEVAAQKPETKLLSLDDTPATTTPQKAKPLKISDETMRRFTELSNQGFKVRDIFYANGIHLILERNRR